MTALEARAMRKSFGTRLVVDGADVVAAAGRVVGLLGPNGAGKSTLLSLLDGTQRSDGGSVILGGVDITTATPTRRARLGVGRTFQQLALFPGLTVTEHLWVAAAGGGPRALLGDLIGRWGPPTPDRERCDQLLARLGLADDAARPVEGLSLGRARLVELARAMATEPSVLLLDEPSSGLDRADVGVMSRVIRELADEGTVAVVIVEHDLDLVRSVCDDAVALSAGTVVAAGSIDSVLEDAEVRRSWSGELA